MSLFRGWAGKTRAQRCFELENLEDRVYLSLVPSIMGTLPTSLIATEKTTAAVTVDLTNSGSTAIKGPYTLTLYADTTNSTQTLGTLTEIISKNETLGELAAGRSMNVKVPLGEFPDVANGNYYVLADLSGTLTSSGTNYGASSGTIAVTDPFIDLTDAVTLLSPASRTITAGKSFTYSVEVFNHGNVAAKGPLAVSIFYSANSDGSSPTLYGTRDETINLAAGAHITFTAAIVTPTNVTPGTYYLVAQVDPDNTFNESNITNNTAVTPTALTINSPYPNVEGAYTTISKVTSGTAKETTNLVTIDVTGQSNNGSLTGTFTINSGTGTLSGTLTGSVTTAGKIAITATIQGVNYVPVGGLVYTIAGTVKNNQFTGTFSSTDEVGVLIPAMPNGSILGDYTGTATTDTGSNAGQVQALTIDIIGEDIDGDLTGTVTTTNGGSLLEFFGSVNLASGKFTITVLDTDSSGDTTTTVTGTAVGDTLSGTFVSHDTSADAGTFSVSK